VSVIFGAPGLLNGTPAGLTVLTNASGVASITATAGPVPLSYAIATTVTGVSPVIFSLAVTP